MNASSPQLGALGGTSGFSSSTSSLPKPVLSLSPPTATTTTTTSTSTTTTTAAPALPSLSATPSLGGSSSNATISPRPRGGPLRLRALGSNSASTSSLPTVTRSRWTVQSLQPITVHSGFLTKKGGRGLQQNWRKRWFVLTSDKRLFYFASQRDADPKGIIDLDKYNEVVEVEGTWPRVHRFNLLNTDSRLSIRTFFLVSASKAENDEWMAKIMSIISVRAVALHGDRSRSPSSLTLTRSLINNRARSNPSSRRASRSLMCTPFAGRHRQYTTVAPSRSSTLRSRCSWASRSW